MPLNTPIMSILGTKWADFRKYKILKSNELTIEPSLDIRKEAIREDMDNVHHLLKIKGNFLTSPTAHRGR